METNGFCAMCKQSFSNCEKPFIPVNCNAKYHWKCYVKLIKEKSEPALCYDEYEEIYEQL